MPIYAYRCNHCGYNQDVLQKMSDPVLTVCPSCGQAEFKKQVTAAGFQLKGSGWYVTDFKGGSGGTNSSTSGSTSDNSASNASSTATNSDSGAGSTTTSTPTTTTE